MPEITNEPYLTHGSFKFGNIDMYDRFKIMVLETGMPEDLFIPSIRERKVEVPNRHGKFDFGAKYYEERELTLNCIAAEPPTGMTLREYVREITYILSKKDKIRLWNEPDKYYVGRIYDATELTQLRDLANEFSITFTCEPFAYGASHTIIFNSLSYAVNYLGTAPTPTLITIKNVGETDITDLMIKQIDRKED